VKVALITTTINVPRVLSLYRAHDPDVMFFVAGDLKTPQEAFDFCINEIGQCCYLDVSAQKARNYKCSELIGWNTDSRRNIALLEAMTWGAKLIISVDDDMPCVGNPFNKWRSLFDGHFGSAPWSGPKLGTPERWFDHGQYTLPPVRARGLPYPEHYVQYHSDFRCAIDVEIGMAQGIILGVPDMDATTSLSHHSLTVTGVQDLLRHGFVLDPRANAVMNSQFTAFRAELAPAFAQFYFAQQRNTDIFASLLMRRIMRQRNLYSYYGPPFGWHDRMPRPLLKDLQAERYGVDNIAAYADYLNRAPLPEGASVLECCRILAQGWNGPELEAALAFYDDCEQVLA
jgi:hypothetical protein